MQKNIYNKIVQNNFKVTASSIKFVGIIIIVKNIDNSENVCCIWLNVPKGRKLLHVCIIIISLFTLIELLTEMIKTLWHYLGELIL